MELNKKRETEYMKRWQLYKSKKDEKNQGKRSLKSRRQTICFGEGKSSFQQDQPEDLLVCQSGAESTAKDLKRSTADKKAFSSKQLRFSTSSSKPAKSTGSKREKGTTLMPAKHSLHHCYVASRTDSNLTKLREEARKKPKNVEPAIEACEYKLHDLLATSMNFGTPNTVRVPQLFKKVPGSCLTEQNGNLPVQQPLKLTVMKENAEPVPTVNRKNKHLYRSKEAIRRKTTEQPPDQNAVNDENGRQEILGQLKSVVEECSILLDSDCPPGCILPWLEEIQQKIPQCFHSADFWLLKARVHFLLMDVDQLFEVFGNAMKYKATPADVISESLPKMIKELVLSNEKAAASSMMTPARCAAGCVPYTPSQTPYDMASTHELDIHQYADTPLPHSTPDLRFRSFHSGNIKYLVRKSTPFKDRSNTKENDDAILITPVRRTTRRSIVSARKSRLDVIIDSLDDSILGDKKNVLFKDNPAIPL